MTVNQVEKAALTLGSNVGDRLANLRAAVEGIRPYAKIIALSNVYETAPLYMADQPVFLNAALVGETALDPLTFLHALKGLEVRLGRQETFRNGPRVIDIDIIFYGDQAMVTSDLTLPHPALSEREFVLRPLAEIASNWRHPETEETVAEMLARMPSLSPKCIGPL